MQRALPSPSSSHLSSPSNKTHYYLWLVFSEMCELTHISSPLAVGDERVGWGGAGCPDSDFGGGQPEASQLTSWGSGGRGRVHFQKRHSSALLIFNLDLLTKKESLLPGPLPHSRVHHTQRETTSLDCGFLQLLGKYLQDGSRGSGRHITLGAAQPDGRRFPVTLFLWVLSSSTTHQSSRKTAAVSIGSSHHTRPEEGAYSHQ